MEKIAAKKELGSGFSPVEIQLSSPPKAFPRSFSPHFVFARRALRVSGAMSPALALGAACSSFVACPGASFGVRASAKRPGGCARFGAHRHRGRHGRDGTLRVFAAGAFTKLIEIPFTRGIAQAVMVPARRFMDGASANEEVVYTTTVRVGAGVVVASDEAPLLGLSGYDVGEVPFVMQAVCYYPTTLDVETLEKSLKQVLSKYPLLAGRLDLSNPDARKKGVRLTNDGCPLRVVASSLKFQNLPQDYAEKTRKFLDYEPWIDIMLGGSPVFTAKITQLSGGGSALGVCMSHAVSDGQGFIEFLVAWSLRAQGKDHPLGDPVFDRALLPATPKLEKNEMIQMLQSEGFASKDPVLMLAKAVAAGRTLVPDFLRFPPGNRAMVPVSSQNLQKIIKAAGDGVSRNEALSAHVWLTLAELLEGDFLPAGSVLEHVTVVTCRGGKKGLPDMYFGNASIGVCTGRLKVGDPDLCSIKSVRDAIRPGLMRALMRRSKFLMLTECTFQAGVSAFDFDINNFMQGNTVWCNNLTDIYLKLYALDFGTGKGLSQSPHSASLIAQTRLTLSAFTIRCAHAGASARAERYRADPVQSAVEWPSRGGKRRGDVSKPTTESHGQAKDTAGVAETSGGRGCVAFLSRHLEKKVLYKQTGLGFGEIPSEKKHRHHRNTSPSDLAFPQPVFPHVEFRNVRHVCLRPGSLPRARILHATGIRSPRKRLFALARCGLRGGRCFAREN